MALRKLLFSIPTLQRGKLRLQEFRNYIGSRKVEEPGAEARSAWLGSNALKLTDAGGVSEGRREEDLPNACFSGINAPFQLKADPNLSRSPFHGPSVPLSLSLSVLFCPTASPLFTYSLFPFHPQSLRLQAPFPSVSPNC